MDEVMEYHDPAASETADQDALRREVERFRNQVKASDLVSDRRTCETDEPHWAWRKR